MRGYALCLVLLVACGTCAAQQGAPASDKAKQAQELQAEYDKLRAEYEQLQKTLASDKAKLKELGGDPVELAKRQQAKARILEQIHFIKDTGVPNLTKPCLDQYRQHALERADPLDPFSEDDTKVWCFCLDVNLRHRLSNQELIAYIYDPMAFIDKGLDGRTEDGQRIWRLYTPIASCQR